ncbi:MAG TPA: hypothetical protein VIP77_02360 [Jiangellaceae bacterium]
MATTKGERRRAELISAAAGILLADGIEAISHRAVATAAGVPLGATTYYFATLDDLRQAAVDALVASDITRMDSATSGLATRERGARATARMIVTLLTPSDPRELIAWYERYVRSARDPLLAGAAQRTNAAARAHTATVLERSGWASTLPADVVLAVVDGAVIGALAEGRSPSGARTAAAEGLRIVLERCRPG